MGLGRQVFGRTQKVCVMRGLLAWDRHLLNNVAGNASVYRNRLRHELSHPQISGMLRKIFQLYPQFLALIPRTVPKSFSLASFRIFPFFRDVPLGVLLASHFTTLGLATG